MQPRCPRCDLPLDAIQSRPSHSGAVHPECVRPEDARPPAALESPHAIERGAPKYGGPPIRRYGCALVTLALLAVILLLAAGPRLR